MSFRETEKTGEILRRLEEDAARGAFERIRCPRCFWRPTAASRWMCADAGAPEYFSGGCRTSWNTFETRGVCPGCAHRWIWTSCLACHRWSRHEDWYEKP